MYSDIATRYCIYSVPSSKHANGSNRKFHMRRHRFLDIIILLYTRDRRTVADLKTNLKLFLNDFLFCFYFVLLLFIVFVFLTSAPWGEVTDRVPTEF